jgi:DNA-binding transcriptional ArsR family regulator
VNATKRRTGQSGKKIDEVVAYALGHRTRICVLTILNEGTYTPEQIAQIIDEPTNNVSHHIRELLDAGSIEVAKTEKVRNTTLHYYRAIKMPYYSDEEMAAMTPEHREVTFGLNLQCMMAEAMAGLSAGKMRDPRVCMAWRWFNVDERGREEMAEEHARSWAKYAEIEAAATNRRVKSGEDAVSMIVAHMGFQRARTAPRPPGESAV